MLVFVVNQPLQNTNLKHSRLGLFVDAFYKETAQLIGTLLLNL